MSWDHYLPRWVLKGFRDPDRNYYTLRRGASGPQIKSLQKTGARREMNKSVAPDVRAIDTEPYWTEWDTAAGEMASRVARGSESEASLAIVVIWATTLPLRAPLWRDAAQQADGDHMSNAGSLEIARAIVGPQVERAFADDAVAAEILKPAPGMQFITGDCGCVYVDRCSASQVSPVFVLPWDVDSFEPTEPEPDYSRTPKQLSAFASITSAVAIHFAFVPQGQGGDRGTRLLDPIETKEYNGRFAAAAKDELYGTRSALTRFVCLF